MSEPISLEGKALQAEIDHLKRTLIWAGIIMTACAAAAYILGYRDGSRD